MVQGKWSKTYQKQGLSDHDMLFVETQNKEKRQYWRCNISLLKIEDFNTQLRKIVDQKAQQYTEPTLKDWEQIKNTLCDHLKARGMQENTKKREQIPWLKNHAEEDPLLRNEYTALIQKEVDWLKVRAFQNTTLEGTIPTKWTYAVNGARQKERKISSLRNANGDTTTDKEEIAKVVMEYWKDLLTKREIDKNKDMATKVQRLNKNNREKINKEITLEEMQTATQQLTNNKTPGSDGIPAEVYKLYPKMV